MGTNPLWRGSTNALSLASNKKHRKGNASSQVTFSFVSLFCLRFLPMQGCRLHSGQVILSGNTLIDTSKGEDHSGSQCLLIQSRVTQEIGTWNRKRKANFLILTTEEVIQVSPSYEKAEVRTQSKKLLIRKGYLLAMKKLDIDCIGQKGKRKRKCPSRIFW